MANINTHLVGAHGRNVEISFTMEGVNFEARSMDVVPEGNYEVLIDDAEYIWNDESKFGKIQCPLIVMAPAQYKGMMFRGDIFVPVGDTSDEKVEKKRQGIARALYSIGTAEGKAEEYVARNAFKIAPTMLIKKRAYVSTENRTFVGRKGDERTASQVKFWITKDEFERNPARGEVAPADILSEPKAATTPVNQPVVEPKAQPQGTIPEMGEVSDATAALKTLTAL